MNTRDPHPLLKWPKGIVAVAGAIVTLAGAVAVISHTTHWLLGATHSPSNGPSFSSLERSPDLGISFFQDGRLSRMSWPGPVNQGGTPDTVTVSLKYQPFELWFPDLGSKSSINVCASPSRVIFNPAVLLNPNNAKNCLNEGNAVADNTYGSGGLWVSRDPSSDAIHTVIQGTRAQLASNGDEKFYVSNLVSWHRNFYLVIYRDDDNYRNFDPAHVEFFALNFS